MLRVTTLFAGTAAATARYYTLYLADVPGEIPGVWRGRQADRFGRTRRDVTTDALEALLLGCDPVVGTRLGTPLTDRTTSDGRIIRAVAGFDATFSAPKSLSVLWALSGDDRFAACHDVAVDAALTYLERYGATTRIRSNGARMHPDTDGLTMAAFRQSTSRADDPQLHTHAVISAKVHTPDGRWLALDARVLKQHQRALGGLYQAVLRAETSHRLGVTWGPVINGQADIIGVPTQLIQAFSKRAASIDTDAAVKIAEFVTRNGRDPSAAELTTIKQRAALETRQPKTGASAPDLRDRWLAETAAIGIDPTELVADVTRPGRDASATTPLRVGDVIEHLTERHSVWHHMNIVQTVADLTPTRGLSGAQLLSVLDRTVDAVIADCTPLDPDNPAGSVRRSDGRSVWIEPVAANLTHHSVIAQDDRIVTYGLDTADLSPQPSTTIDVAGLDVMQADAARAVAGNHPLVVIVGPAGAGKTTMLRAAVHDLHNRHIPVIGLSPTARAAHVLHTETGVYADTVAKFLHEHRRPGGPRPDWHLPAGGRVIVDEAGMLSTPDLYALITLAEQHHWNLALIGDPRQLQAVHRGGMFHELCTTTPTIQLDTIHRFTNPWEAEASLQLRNAHPHALDPYQSHGRIIPGTLDDHLDRIARTWLERHHAGDSVAVTATSNEHVGLINAAIQRLRSETGDIEPGYAAASFDGGPVYVGDRITTRHNQRSILATDGSGVHNRDLWTVTAVRPDGGLTAQRLDSAASVTLPAVYVLQHVELGYAATEPGNQSVTDTISLTLASPSTTARGLYMAMTRGRDNSTVLVITETPSAAEARSVLDGILAIDGHDTPAITQQRTLASADRPAPAVQRCAIPDWFHDQRRHLVEQWHHANNHIETAAAHRQHLTDQLDSLQTERAASDQDAQPIDTLRADARRQLTAAETERRQAKLALDNAGPFTRRTARHDLAIADDRVHGLRSHLRELDRIAAPAGEKRRNLDTAIRDARRNVTSHDLHRRHNPHLTERNTIRRTIEALDTWHHWANGKPINHNDLRTSLETLRTTPYQNLTVPVAEWAQRNHITLEPPRPVRTIERGIDLGIGL